MESASQWSTTVEPSVCGSMVNQCGLVSHRSGAGRLRLRCKAGPGEGIPPGRQIAFFSLCLHSVEVESREKQALSCCFF